jgi:uncharacterized glyoxalase superfamily protein PhnB
VLRVESAQAARDFFEPLGFERVFCVPARTGAPEPSYSAFRRGDVVIHASSHGGDGVGGAVVFILVEDVDALHAEFTGKGIAIDMTPVDQTWGMREMYVKDAMRNTLRFAHPID